MFHLQLKFCIFSCQSPVCLISKLIEHCTDISVVIVLILLKLDLFSGFREHETFLVLAAKAANVASWTLHVEMNCLSYRSIKVKTKDNES